MPYVDEYDALEPSGAAPDVETADVLVTVYVTVSAILWVERTAAVATASSAVRRFMVFGSWGSWGKGGEGKRDGIPRRG